MNVIFYQEPELDGVTYPTSAKVISWLIAMFPMTVMLAWFLYEYCYNGGGYEVSLLLLFTPPPSNKVLGHLKESPYLSLCLVSATLPSWMNQF